MKDNEIKLKRELTKEEKLKEKPYVKEKTFFNGKSFFVIVVIVYIFFFSSTFFMNNPLLAETKIGEEVAYMDGRTYKLISAIYDEDKDVMEVVLDLQNNTLDNINDYYYALNIKKGNKDKIEIKEIYNEPLLTVIRIYNVPSRYRELELLFAPKTVEAEKITDSMTATIRINEKNVKQAKVNEKRSVDDYLVDRLKTLIAALDKNIKETKKEIDKLAANVKSIEKEEKDFWKKKEFMSSVEIQKEASKINSNKDRLKIIADEKRKLEEELKKYKDEKNNLQEKLENLK